MTFPRVERAGTRPDTVVGAGSAVAGTVRDELGAQVRAVLGQLPSAATAMIRVRHDDGDSPALAAAEVWTIPGASEPARCVRDLPAAVGLRMGMVEQALDQAGVSYPRADLGLRARWRRLPPVAGQRFAHELVVSVPAHHGRHQPGGPQEPGHG